VFNEDTGEAARRKSAAVYIQKMVRGFMQKMRYQKMLAEHLIAQEDARDLLEKKRVERWILERETERLQMQIEERNRLFKSQLNRRIQAAIVI
jgi:hypothetical protein